MWTRHRSHSGADGPISDSENNYLASASDLMIGLLFVFIILVVVLALQQRNQAQLAAQAKKKAEEEMQQLLHAGDPRGRVTSAIGNSLKKVLDVRIDPESGVISLPEKVLFESGKAELTEEGQHALAGSVQQYLTNILPCYVASERTKKDCPDNKAGDEIETIFIEGHTDDVPMLKPGYDNTNLSLDRARAVTRALVQNSPLNSYRNKLDQPLFSLSAYAETRPLKGTLPSDAKNRRVDLRIVMSYRPPAISMPPIKPENSK